MAKRQSTPKIKALVAGNWKMNGTGKQLGKCASWQALLIAKSRAPMS